MRARRRSTPELALARLSGTSLMQELCSRALIEPCDGMHSVLLRCQLARILQLKRHVRLVFGLTESAPALGPMKAFYFCSWQRSGTMADKDVCCLYFFSPSVVLRAGSVPCSAFIRLCYSCFFSSVTMQTNIHVPGRRGKCFNFLFFF